jgi:DNA polymerase-3 subunit alpha
MSDVPIEHLAKAIKNTREIADRITNFPFDTSLKFPTFSTDENETQEEYLTKCSIQGLMKKGLHTKKEYVERLKHELKTIKKLGFSGYFSIVGDLVNSARQNQAVGPGRGSAAGSLVSFCLGITNVDPLKFSLYFERFLDESKGVIMPTFGLEIEKLSLNEEEILKACECHH